MQLVEKPRQLVPAGTHTGTLYRIIDLGTQENETFKNKQRKVKFMFELPDELMETGAPFSVSKTYTMSLSEKAQIVKDLKSWKGETPKSGFDISKLLGDSCNITISHDEGGNGKVYANIASIAPLKKGEKKPAAINDQYIFDLEDYKEVIFQKLSDFDKEAIKKSPEYQNLGGAEQKPTYSAANEVPLPDDEIPF